MADNTQDVVFIGTGPLSIFEALYQQRSGKHVLLIDRAKQFGGAWTTLKLEDLPELEIGCHIWSIHKPSFQFLERYLGLQLEPLRPQPYIQRNGRKLLYDWKMNIITARRVLSNIKRGKFSYFKHDWKSPAYRFSLLPSNYLYPERGATDLMTCLRRKVDEHQLDMQLDTGVTKAVLREGVWELTLSNGSKVNTKSIKITTLSNIAEYEIDGRSYLPSFRTVRYIHVHLVLSDHEGKPFSYIRWMDDPIVHRISDVSAQVAREGDGGKRVVIIGVLENAYDQSTEAELVQEIQGKLKTLELIGEMTRIDQWSFNSYPSDYMDAGDQAKIVAAAGESITVLPSSDFIFGVAAQLERWKDLLPGNAN